MVGRGRSGEKGDERVGRSWREGGGMQVLGSGLNDCLDEGGSFAISAACLSKRLCSPCCGCFAVASTTAFTSEFPDAGNAVSSYRARILGSCSRPLSVCCRR